MEPNIRKILERIVTEMENCKGRDGAPCDDHAVRFGADDLAAAKSALGRDEDEMRESIIAEYAERSVSEANS